VENKVKKKGDEGNIVNKILEICRERKRVERSKKRIMMRERTTKSPISIQTVVGTWNHSTLTFFAFFFYYFCSIYSFRLDFIAWFYLFF